MGTGRALGLVVVAALAGGCAGGGAAEETVPAAAATTWRDHFEVDRAQLAATGRNPWLTMAPGRVLELAEHGNTLRITVLPETKVVDGVTCGILEERETKKGALIEVSRNYFATDPATHDVYYFGEDVDNYRDGKIVHHESAWLAGEKGARFGLMVAGRPVKGDRWFQEIAPDVAMDRVEVVDVDATVKTPAGTFEHCLHLQETTPLESDVSHKYFAPGIGLVKDDGFELAKRP